ncbi:MAG TPA: hypothetical protein VFL85_03070 [Candidatus Saccharimonadales bacterium]|nr:hypothetical protein [Candidatus Saccharimonadales bacterium]
MSAKDAPATRKDIDDVLGVLQTFMQQVDRRFDYQDKQFEAINEKLREHDKKLADLSGAVAELSAQVRDYHNEMLAQSRQMDRLREAILQIAKETGVKLEVEL